MAQEKEVLFKEYVFPRTHELHGKKQFRQVTRTQLNLLARKKADFEKAKAAGKAKAGRRSLKDYSEPHEWNESPGPQSYEDVVNTIFTSNKVRLRYEEKFPAPGEAPIKRAEKENTQPVILFPEIDNLDLAALIEFAIGKFPEKEVEIKKIKAPDMLRANIRSWGKAEVAA